MAGFISLGGDCQPAQQIIHNGGLEKHFFDWLIAPIISVERLIRTDFARFVETGDLVADQDAARLYKVTDTYNNVHLVHDFKVFNEESVKTVQAKYRYLATKFRQIAAGDADDRPYFVRRWHTCDDKENEESARALHELLTWRFPGSRMLYLHADPMRPAVIAGSYRSAYLPQSDDGWEGDHAAWRRLLREFAVGDPRDHKADAGGIHSSASRPIDM